MALNTVVLNVYEECHLCCVVTSPNMLSVVMLNVAMLGVLAPKYSLILHQKAISNLIFGI